MQEKAMGDPMVTGVPSVFARLPLTRAYSISASKGKRNLPAPVALLAPRRLDILFFYFPPSTQCLSGLLCRKDSFPVCGAGSCAQLIAQRTTDSVRVRGVAGFPSPIAWDSSTRRPYVT